MPNSQSEFEHYAEYKVYGDWGYTLYYGQKVFNPNINSMR